MLNKRVYEYNSCPIFVEYIQEMQKADDNLQQYVTKYYPTEIFIKVQLGGKIVSRYYSNRMKEEPLIFVSKAIREDLVE